MTESPMTEPPRSGGPLYGLRVIELGGIGPLPFFAMLLADMGADVVTIDSPSGSVRKPDLLRSGRRTLSLDLKNPEQLDVVQRLVSAADIFAEPFRPGVAERLGLGPDQCRARNDRLIYVRMAGWGRGGTLDATPGYDINFLALSGVLSAVGSWEGPPVPPLNLVGDFGGGAVLAVGVLSALIERAASGRGQVVDGSILDGASLLATAIHSFRAQGTWVDERGHNIVDSGAPYYGVYETSDRKFVAIGAVDRRLFQSVLDRLGTTASASDPLDRSCWADLHVAIENAVRQRTRDEWAEEFAAQGCLTPVLSFDEAIEHPHNRARSAFVGTPEMRPSPTPRLSRTPAIAKGPERAIEAAELIDEWTQNGETHR